MPVVPGFEETALRTVSAVDTQACAFISTAPVTMWRVPKSVDAWAVMKAITTPEPGPISITKGVGVDGVEP
ncbi:hypothetical protein RRF57_008648 [Xylaria bambusicola]|uniref:Uncharacterized protein n=1 Tax=Xylaria bambusicola TaxID=326684 RepID=A0AAN7USG8_9PEZI